MQVFVRGWGLVMLMGCHGDVAIGDITVSYECLGDAEDCVIGLVG